MTTPASFFIVSIFIYNFFFKECITISGTLTVPTISMESCSNTQSSNGGSTDDQSHDEVRLNPSRIKNHRKNSIVRSTYEPISDNNGSNSNRNSNSSRNSNSNSKMSNLLFQNTGCKITHWNSTPLLLISGVLLCSAIIVVLNTFHFHWNVIL